MDLNQCTSVPCVAAERSGERVHLGAPPTARRAVRALHVHDDPAAAARARLGVQLVQERARGAADAADAEARARAGRGRVVVRVGRRRARLERAARARDGRGPRAPVLPAGLRSARCVAH